MKTGKRYAELVKLVDKSTLYDPSEAAKLVCETGKAKFDETVELHVRLGVDSRHADQQVRGAVVLPHGTGRTKTVLVLAKGPKADEAKEAGAEFVGDDDMIAKIEKENWFDFDVIIATPDMMGKLGKLGKVLGPKGLMPNPKAGTVTMDVTKAVNEVTTLNYLDTGCLLITENTLIPVGINQHINTLGFKIAPFIDLKFFLV